MDDNQEIVTAVSVSDNESMVSHLKILTKKIFDNENLYSQENFLFNVSASVTPTKKVNPVDDFDTTLNMISTTESEISSRKKNRKE